MQLISRIIEHSSWSIVLGWLHDTTSRMYINSNYSSWMMPMSLKLRLMSENCARVIRREFKLKAAGETASQSTIRDTATACLDRKLKLIRVVKCQAYIGFNQQQDITTSIDR